MTELNAEHGFSPKLRIHNADYPTDPKYDPRAIYDAKNYGGFTVARRRRFFR